MKQQVVFTSYNKTTAPKVASTSGGCKCVVDDFLSLESENPVQNKVITARLEEVFQSVSEGKRLIALALTEKGIPTSATATFEEMYNNLMTMKKMDLDLKVVDYFIPELLDIQNLDVAIANISDIAKVERQTGNNSGIVERFSGFDMTIDNIEVEIGNFIENVTF